MVAVIKGLNRALDEVRIVIVGVGSGVARITDKF